MELETLLITFPKKDMFTKDRVYNDALELIEYVTIANYEKRIDVKTTYKIKALAKINKLDFYLERCLKNKYINNKVCEKLSNNLLIIMKMIYGWIKSESKC
mgnify:CR=1 FL=1